MISEEELNEIENRANQAQTGPWKAYIEDRDHECGSSFIIIGEENSDTRGEDLGLDNATIADFDFIANARQDIPRLIKEIRELQKKLN